MQGYRLPHMLARRPGPFSGFSTCLRASRPGIAPAAASPSIVPSRQSPSPYQPAPSQGSISYFTTTPPALAKKPKKNKSSKASKSSSPSDEEDPDASKLEPVDEDDPATSPHPPPDPSNFSVFADLESRFARAGERFSDLIRKLRSGQTSLAVEEISSVRVRPDKSTSTTYPLRELATVVPRSGRMVSILVHEQSFVKPIMSAVQASPAFNQQPQRAASSSAGDEGGAAAGGPNDLELTMKIARETPQEMAARVRDAAHAYKEAVRLARQKREKIHQRWLKEGVWLPDLKFKGDKELQKKVEKKNAEIEKLEAQTLKSIASMREE